MSDTTFNIYKELLESKTLLAYIFMNEVHKTDYYKNFPSTVGSKPKETVEIRLTIDGQDINPRHFFEHVEEQWEEILKAKATEMVKEQTSDKFYEIVSLINTLQEKVESANESIDWDTNFKK